MAENPLKAGAVIRAIPSGSHMSGRVGVSVTLMESSRYGLLIDPHAQTLRGRGEIVC